VLYKFVAFIKVYLSATVGWFEKKDVTVGTFSTFRHPLVVVILALDDKMICIEKEIDSFSRLVRHILLIFIFFRFPFIIGTILVVRLAVLFSNSVLQGSLHLSIRESNQIKISRCKFTEPLQSHKTSVTFLLWRQPRQTYHPTCTSDTVRIYGRVVNTNSLKTTHSG
jgi:hypothetical protein